MSKNVFCRQQKQAAIIGMHNSKNVQLYCGGPGVPGCPPCHNEILTGLPREGTSAAGMAGYPAYSRISAALQLVTGQNDGETERLSDGEIERWRDGATPHK